jgi:hypothetical protein
MSLSMLIGTNKDVHVFLDSNVDLLGLETSSNAKNYMDTNIRL